MTSIYEETQLPRKSRIIFHAKIFVDVLREFALNGEQVCKGKLVNFTKFASLPPRTKQQSKTVEIKPTQDWTPSSPALPSGHKTAASPSRFVVVSTNLSSSCVFDWKTSELGNFLKFAAVTARQLQSGRENEFVIQVLWVVYGSRIAEVWHCLYIKFKFWNLSENLDFPRSYQFRRDSNTTFKCS